MIRIGVVGAGLIGRERLEAVRHLARKGRPVALAGLYDANAELGRTAAAEFSTVAFDSLDRLIEARPDWLVIALPHDIAVTSAQRALERGISVVLEKPMGRGLDEARLLLEAGGERLRIGFNYRFFPGVRQALRDARRGSFGEMIALNLLLGHGGAPGQEKSWKLDPIRAGGGSLIDPGVHLLDLCLLLAPGRIDVLAATSWSGFWNTGIEEDVTLLLSAGGVSISVVMSIVRWRSTFRMELHGRDGYGIVTGRNRSYGPQRYVTGPRWGWQSAPSQMQSETLVVESDGRSVLADELDALLFPTDAADAWPAPATAAEAMVVMQLLDRVREILGLRRRYSPA